jgi:hypothetical protein
MRDQNTLSSITLSVEYYFYIIWNEKLLIVCIKCLCSHPKFVYFSVYNSLLIRETETMFFLRNCSYIERRLWLAVTSTTWDLQQTC